MVWMKANKTREQRQQSRSRRIRIIVSAFILVLAGTTFLFKSKLISAPNPLEAADRELEAVQENSRGSILDRNFGELAASYRTTAVYARPLELENPEIAASMLAGILGLNEKDLATELKSERSFIWLGKDIEQTEAEKISGLDLKGIYLKNGSGRFYPHRQTAAHLVGFVKDRQGLDGIEFQFDNLLRGNAPDSEIPGLTLADKNSNDLKKVNLVLTVDLRCQSLAEQYLQAALDMTGAFSGMAAVMDPKTGAILAMANLPSFDPNKYWDFSDEIRRNRFISDRILPAVLTVSDLTDTGDYGQQTADPPALAAGAAPVLVPEKMKVTIKIAAGPAPVSRSKSVFEYLMKLNRGFTVDLPVSGNNGLTGMEQKKSPGSLPPQLSEITALQLLSAFSCFANGGTEISPHLLRSILSRHTGKTVSAAYSSGKNGIITPGNLEAFQQEIMLAGISGQAGSVLFEPLTLFNQRQAGPDANEEPAADEEPAAGRNISIMLGSIPKDKPELALIAVIDHASPADLISPAMLAMGEDLLPELLSAYRQPVQAPPSSRTAKTEQPAGTIRTDESTALKFQPEAEAPARMPELKGRSLRNGLQLLQQYKLKISLSGSGTIVSQQPLPGSIIGKGDKCVLRLSMGQ